MRWGTAKLSTLGIVHDPHASTHAHPPLCLDPSEPHTADGTSSDQLTVTEREQEKSILTPTLDLEHASHHTTTTPALASAQLVGIAILEFGVVLHSFLIGLTLAVTENFKILFIVLVFHRTSSPSPFPPPHTHTLTNTHLNRNIRRPRRRLPPRLPRPLRRRPSLVPRPHLRSHPLRHHHSYRYRHRFRNEGDV